MAETKEETVAEFTSDEQRDAYIAALEVEAKSCTDTAAAGNMTDEQRATRSRRAKEAAAELDRVRGATGKRTRLRGEAE
jgi:hypothetical protein